MTHRAVRDSVRQLDANRWIVAERFTLTRTQQQSPNAWSDGDGSFYVASEDSRSESEGSKHHPFEKVYDAGDSHAVWRIGDAFLKIVILASPEITREHTTLEFMNQMQLDFTIPKVLFHGEWDGRYYLIVSRVPGQTLNTVWPTIDETARSRLVKRISNICMDLAVNQADYIGGVDGKCLPETLLAQRNSRDFSRPAMLQACKELEMGSRTFFLCHCDLGPTNILIDRGTIGIIDWECVGYVPKEWIRSKFRLSGGMDLENEETEKDPEARYEWRKRVAVQLGEDGFQDCGMKWMSWRRNS